MAEHNDFPQAVVEPKKRHRLSIVWIIPILAALVAVGIAVQRILSEGPTITIVLNAAQGIEAGKTTIKYKDVNIGQVKAVHLSKDYRKVVVTAKMSKDAEGLLMDDAKFWVVQPRVTLSGISGLGTLLSGNYIGFKTGKSDKKQREFTGLDTPPPLTDGRTGRQFILKADSLGSLGVGAPVYYRSLQAGEVIAYKLASDGKGVEISIFVDAPYDRYISDATRFWNASGIDVSIGASGMQVRTESLVALLAGGVAFDAPSTADTAAPAATNTAFTLHPDKASAMKQPDRIAQHYLLYFNESLRGLTVGAPVTLLGLQAGEVTDVGIDIDPVTQKLRGRVEVVAYPERVVSHLRGQQAAAGESIAQNIQKRRAFFQRMVEQLGMRAQLQTGSLLTGQLYVAFDFFPNAKKMKIDWGQDPPVIPTVPSPIPNIEEKIGSILNKLDSLNYEAIGADLQKTLKTLNQSITDVDKAVIRFNSDVTPEIKAAIEDFRRATVAAEKMIKNTDATLVGTDAPGQQELRDALQEVARAARSLRVLIDYLDQHPEALIRGKTEEKP